jgi:hypothetical protein
MAMQCQDFALMCTPYVFPNCLPGHGQKEKKEQAKREDMQAAREQIRVPYDYLAAKTAPQ